VLLLATHHGVQAALLSPASEALGGPAHGETAPAGERPAVILQFGRGHVRPVTARRPVAQVLRVLSPGKRAAGRRPGAAAPGHRGPLLA
jgi:hypothetical protein